MRKQLVIFGIFLTLVLTSMAILPTSSADTEEEPLEIILWAGQNTEVGKVNVWNDGDNLYVEYEITECGWEIIDTHLYVGKTDPNDLTTAPGQFPYSGETEYVIPLDDICGYEMEKNKKGKETGKMIPTDDCGVNSVDSVYIAAHADVKYETWEYDCINVVSDTTTQWSDLCAFKHDAVLCWEHPSWADVPGASWIWRTEYTDVVYEYDNVPMYEMIPKYGWLFTKEFTLPDDAYDIVADININVDNSYELSLNGGFVGSEGSMHRDGPDSHEWSTVDNYDIYPAPGLNELQIRALNYFRTGSSTSNPAGLAFNAEICYKYDHQCREESAWAEGTDFDHPNWAMYFTYDIQGWTEKCTINVCSDGSTESVTLDAGKEYLFEVSGIYKYGNWDGGVYADAEWADRGTGGDPLGYTGWIKGDTGYSTDIGLDLYFIDDGSNVGIDWGDYNDGHEYSCKYSPTTSTLGMRIWDSGYGDNSGYLTVHIYEWV